MNKTMKGLILGIIIGAVLMLPVSSFASSLTQYILVKAQYPIMVDDNLYEGDLPILNYEGSTYVPLRTMSELLNVNIFWNETLKQVEITHGDPTENQAFRNISVTGSQGNYVVTGEARIFEAVLQYEVEDGHFVYLEGFEMASAGAPDWGTFTINLNIPEADLPGNATLMLILFEESAMDGSRVNELFVVLEVFP
ncbi:MAG: Gmad2 immunoglobulin-like domain-containing protein [Eubacteriales bacterium]|nr:Gmad2 immunoglobulin-like domain-containing protein [Eubacteriales bacterium]